MLLLSAAHDLVLEHLGGEVTAEAPATLTSALLLLPVAYAALVFGLGGAVATASWATFLVIPHWVLYGHHDLAMAHLWVEITSFVLLMAVAVLVGSRVEREQAARLRAEEALQAASVAQARYHALFDDHSSPVVVTSGTGTVVELNTAAAALLGPDAVGLPLDASLGVSVDRLRGGGPPYLTCGDRQFLATTTEVTSSSSPLVQVVLTDCTEQHRRQAEHQAFSARLIGVVEDERRRLARELHDEPLQQLVYVARSLGDLEHVEGLPAGLVEELHRDAVLSRGAADGLRKLIRGLRPPVLDDLGLVPAVRQLVEQAGERAGLEVRLTLTGTPVRLPPEVELTAYRVVQESLSNVLRHAEAGTAEVALELGPELVVLVADDGRGFDTDGERRPRAERGMGLLGMAERIAAVDGTLDVTSSPGAGTQVRARIPLSGLAKEPAESPA